MDAPMRTAVLLLSLLVPAVAIAAPVGQATATDKAHAREAYREGQRLVEARDYAAALNAFRRGFNAYEDPIFIFNIAQCHRLLGNKELAAKWYRNFLERVPEPPNLAEIQRWLAKLDREIEAEKRAGAASASEQERPVPQGDEPAARGTDEAPSSEPVPVYKKWWLWTIVGVVVVGAGLGIGLGLGLRKPPAFNQTLGDFGPGATQTTGAGVELRF
jgi:tetratricopeptide (TPR) repeat protein